MRKIPTLFLRDESRRYVTDQVNPGCEWVLAGEGVATRKYDGTCVMFDGNAWWARREVKPGKALPGRFQLVSVDVNTGKAMGWEPIDQSSFAKYALEAIGRLQPDDCVPGTYELLGPKVNGNPEGIRDHHILVNHAAAYRWRALDKPDSFDELRGALTCSPWEGVVWHHPDGHMAKLKRRDFEAIWRTTIMHTIDPEALPAPTIVVPAPPAPIPCTYT